MSAVTFDETSVTHWFGSQFEQLHPLLQNLHRHGGVLKGTVNIEYGQGMAKWFGKRLAKKLGIPIHCSSCAFEVEINHQDGFLIWNRCFANKYIMRSVFQPVGIWPNGYWVEQTGFLQLYLTVDIIEGGWYWRVLRAQIKNFKLPVWLLPRSEAYKRIENGKYFFHVQFALPLLGKLLSYGGWLDVS